VNFLDIFPIRSFFDKRLCLGFDNVNAPNGSERKLQQWQRNAKKPKESSQIMNLVEIEKITATPLCIGKRDAANLLGISERTLTTRSIEGEIPSLVIGGRRLYPFDLLQEWIRKKVAEQRTIDGPSENEQC
jgi:excisionase family DNA binding protein